MPNQVTLNATLQYEDITAIRDEIQIPNFIKELSTKGLQHCTKTILTTETAIPLGPLTTLGYCTLVNLDPNNYVDVKTANTAGAGKVFARLHPADETGKYGGFCTLFLGSDAQAPYAIANSAPCDIEIFITSQ